MPASVPNAATAATAATTDQAALVAELQRQIAAQQAQIDAQAKAIAELRGLVVGKSGPVPTPAVAVPVVTLVNRLVLSPSADTSGEPGAVQAVPDRTVQRGGCDGW